MRVGNVMGEVAFAVLESTPVADLLAMVGRLGVGAVVVVDGERRPVGLVSTYDLLPKLGGEPVRGGLFGVGRRRQARRKAAARTAGELMTRPVVVVTPATTVREAARLMHEYAVEQLPVVGAADGPMAGRVVGMVRRADVLAVFGYPNGMLRERVVAVVAAVLGERRRPPLVEVLAGVVRIEGEVRDFWEEMALLRAVRGVAGVIDVEVRLAYSGWRTEGLAAPAYQDISL